MWNDSFRRADRLSLAVPEFVGQLIPDRIERSPVTNRGKEQFLVPGSEVLEFKSDGHELNERSFVVLWREQQFVFGEHLPNLGKLTRSDQLNESGDLSGIEQLVFDSLLDLGMNPAVKGQTPEIMQPLFAREAGELFIVGRATQQDNATREFLSG